MTAPRDRMMQMTYQHPQAVTPLFLPVLVTCNTPDEELMENVRINSSRDDLSWLAATEPHDQVAIMVGGGPSIADTLDEIASLQERGNTTIFAMNAASQYVRSQRFDVDFQVIADAKEETATLVDSGAKAHLFASQVNPKTMNAVREPIVWHLENRESGNVELHLPKARAERGGYAVIGGGASAGNSALCVAYALGYREMHLFGYDSCHRNQQSHAYDQPMNRFIPTVDVEWGGKVYASGVAMRSQAERFQLTAAELKSLGCEIYVYGEGLLQAMYRTPPEDLNEREKYRVLWQFDGYRNYAPGEEAVDQFIEVAKPDGMIIDFGCGTGRPALALNSKGHNVVLVDFADNCRDEEAMGLPFVEWNLVKPCPLRAPYGFCTDVMEHIPTDDVDAVITNIMTSASTVFFQISLTEDAFGVVIGQKLHNTVKSFEWWKAKFEELRFLVQWSEITGPNAASFLVAA